MTDFPLFSDPGWRDDEVPPEIHWTRYVQACQALVADTVVSTGASRGQVAHSMSEDLVARLFGQGWLAPLLLEAKTWTRTQDIADKRAYLLEVVQLGRYLFDLQAFDFYDSLISDLRERPDLRGVMFEAEVAWLLGFIPLRSGLRIRSGVKGGDYDLGVQLDNDIEWAIEAKAKDDVVYTAGGLRNPLKKAAPQLPSGGIGSVFFRVPAGWLVDDGYRDGHEEVIADVMRSNSRMHAVVLIGDRWATDPAERYQTPELAIEIVLSPDADERVVELLNGYRQLWSLPPGFIHPVWSGVI